MKQIFMNIKAILGVAVATSMLAMSSVSCSYDDTAIWDEINGIKAELAELRESVEGELNALRELIEGNITIKDVKKVNDGSVVLTLSDDTKITIYPKGDEVPKDLVTVVYENGVYYWAMYDAVGNTIFMYDASGNKIPVADVAPQTRVNEETNAIEVSFDGGNTWITTGYSQSSADSIINNIEVVYSDWQVDSEGNPLALYCILTLNDGSLVKVGMQNGKLVLSADSMFVAYGMTGTFYVDIQDVADYIMQAPRGWEYEVKHRVKEERMELAFTAPTYEAIESGEAVASGIAKMMVVFNNGSSAIASLQLSTNPATVQFTSEGVYVEVGYGTPYLIGGVIGKSSFEKSIDSIVTLANRHLSGTVSSQICDMSFMETNTLFVPYTDLSEATLKAGNEYVFWYASPVTDAEGNSTISKQDICALDYRHITVECKATSVGFFDFTVDVKVKGADANHKYMLGYSLADEFDVEELAQYYTEYPEYLLANHSEESLSGSFLELTGAYASKLEPGTKYVMWYINESSQPNIHVENVLYWEFETLAFTQGGSVSVEVKDLSVEYTSINMTLTTGDPAQHIAMFYNIMPSYMASAYSTDELIIEMLTTEGVSQFTQSDVKVSYTKATAGTALTLFAVAVGADGYYGNILKEEYTTKDFEYNDLSVALTLNDYKIDNTRIGVECAGAEKYHYIYCDVTNEEWAKVYGGSKKKAGEYIIANPDSSRVFDTSDADTALVEGNIVLSGLEMDKEYVVVVMAVDAEGVHSKPEALYFTPIANIGTVVKRDDAHWEVGKPSLTVLDYEDNPHLFLNFAWATVPGEHTKVYTAALFRTNLINEELGTNIDTVEKLIAEIITCCDTGGMSEQGKSFEWNEDGIYVREWKEYEDTNDDGFMEVVEKREENPYGYHFYPYGSSGITFIYTTWVCEDGNFHEPFAIDPTTGKEVSLW